jgi:hypothetical protein
MLHGLPKNPHLRANSARFTGSNNHETLHNRTAITSSSEQTVIAPRMQGQEPVSKEQKVEKPVIRAIEFFFSQYPDYGKDHIGEATFI